MLTQYPKLEMRPEKVRLWISFVIQNGMSYNDKIKEAIL